jgi:ribosomally synthesized peptide (two-chain TOMM family)
MPQPSRRHYPFPFIYDVIIEFRAKVVQMIALCWQDPVIRQELIDDPRAAFLKHLHYEPPYQIDTIVKPDNAVWCPEGFTDWVVHHDEELELYLPPAPADPTQRPAALAAYNSRHLNPFVPTESTTGQ